MPQFYDLETDFETEVEEEFESLQSGSIETEDEYEEITEFGTYDESAAEEKWGKMDFDKLIIEMEALVSRGRKCFFSRKKRVVEAEEIATLSQYIQNKFPQEFVDAKAIIDNEAAIISQAQKEAAEIIASARRQENEIVASARAFYNSTTDKGKKDAADLITRATAQANEMVQEHSITQAAREAAEQLKTNTDVQCKNMKAETEMRCNEMKNEAREWCMGAINGAKNFVYEGLGRYQNVAKASLDEIADITSKLSAEFNRQSIYLGFNNEQQ